MVALYVDGEKVGTLADAERLLTEWTRGAKAIEVRDDGSGRKLGTLTPEPICPWNPDLTDEELDRRSRMPGKPLSEILKRLGAE